MGDVIRYPNMGTVAKAAEIYGLSPAYIRRLCRQGKSGTLWPGIAGWSIWTAWPGTSTRAIQSRRNRMKPWAVSAGS